MSKKLYIYSMKTLGMYFGSPSQTELLRALVCLPRPVGLREVSRIAGIHPHSGELALSVLIRKGLVKRRKTSGRTFYVLDRGHEDAVVLEAVFRAASQGFTRIRSRLLNDRARRILPFIKEASRLIARAREVRHVA